MAFNRYGDDWRAALRVGRPGYFHTDFNRRCNRHYNRYYGLRNYWNDYWYDGYGIRSCAPYYRYTSRHYPYSRYCTSLWNPYYNIGLNFYDPWDTYGTTTVYHDYYRPRYNRHNFYYSTYLIDNDDYPYAEVYGAPEPAVDDERARMTYDSVGTPVGTVSAAGDDWTFFDYGYEAFLLERYDEAQRFFLRAMWAEEWEGVASLMFGLSAYARGDYAIAALAVRQALQTRTDLVDSPLELRSLYTREETLREHIGGLESYSADYSADREARFLLAYLYFSMEEPERALPIVEALTVEQPQDATALYLHEAVKRVLTSTEDKPGQ